MAADRLRMEEEKQRKKDEKMVKKNSAKKRSKAEMNYDKFEEEIHEEVFTPSSTGRGRRASVRSSARNAAKYAPPSEEVVNTSGKKRGRGRKLRFTIDDEDDELEVIVEKRKSNDDEGSDMEEFRPKKRGRVAGTGKNAKKNGRKVFPPTPRYVSSQFNDMNEDDDDIRRLENASSSQGAEEEYADEDLMVEDGESDAFDMNDNEADESAYL
jgi:hypothetical protein